MEGIERVTTRNGSGRDRGAVAVEMALVLPILVMLLVGIIQFGMAYSDQVSLQGAAREGARALALGESGGVAQQAVIAAAPSVDGITFPGGGVISCPTGSTSTSTQYSTMTVSAPYEFSIPFVSLGSITLTATARMRCGL